MPPELPVLAVDGNKVLGPDDIQHQLQFLRAAVSGDVHRRLAAIVIMDVRAAPVKVIEHAEDGLLVAGNYARAQHHFVARAQPYTQRWPDTETRAMADMGSPWLPAMTTATWFRGSLRKSCGDTSMPGGTFSLPICMAISEFLKHAAAHKAEFAAKLMRQIGDDLQPMHGRGKAGNQHAFLGVPNDLRQALPHGAFRGRQARALHIGGIGEQSQHALAPVVGKRVQVAHMLVRGRGVKLEIAGVNDRAQRRGDGQSAGLNDAVRQVNELDAEGAHLERRAGMHLPQNGAFRQIVLNQLGLRQRQGKGRAVNRHINLFQQDRAGRRCDLRGRGSE